MQACLDLPPRHSCSRPVCPKRCSASHKLEVRRRSLIWRMVECLVPGFKPQSAGTHIVTVELSVLDAVTVHLHDAASRRGPRKACSSVSMFLFLYLEFVFVCLSVCLSVYQCLSIYPSAYLSISLSLSLPLALRLCLCFSLSLSLFCSLAVLAAPQERGWRCQCHHKLQGCKPRKVTFGTMVPILEEPVRRCCSSVGQ